MPTSNVCERLFSVADFELSSRRKGIYTIRFEDKIFLHMVDEFWGIQDIHEIMRGVFKSV